MDGKVYGPKDPALPICSSLSSTSNPLVSLTHLVVNVDRPPSASGERRHGKQTGNFNELENPEE